MTAYETVWPIGPPVVTSRNVYVILTQQADGTVTVRILGEVCV